MNNKQLEKLLYQEKKSINHEINSHYRKQEDFTSLFSRRKRLIPIILVILLIASGVVYAGSKMGVLEWFMKESGSYLDILETYPEYKVDIKLEDKEITVNVFGFVTDEENNYLYLEITPGNLYIDELGLINKNDLYKESIQNADYGFYYQNGMSSLIGNQQVYKLKPFDIATSVAEFSIESLRDESGNTYPVDIQFKLPFKKAAGKTVHINATKEIVLPQINEMVTITVENVKFLPTATYIIYDMSHKGKINVELGDIIINNHKIEPFFLSGDDNQALYYPMKAQDIGVFKWSINSYMVEDFDLERFKLDDLPSEFMYKNSLLKMDESIDDGYLSYIITDTGFAERNYMYMDMSIYCGDLEIAHSDSRDAYYIYDDGTVKKLENIIEVMEADVEKIKSKTYALRSHETYNELINKDYIDLENDTKELRIRYLVRAYNVDEEVTFYRNILNQLKGIFTN